MNVGSYSVDQKGDLLNVNHRIRVVVAFAQEATKNAVLCVENRQVLVCNDLASVQNAFQHVSAKPLSHSDLFSHCYALLSLFPYGFLARMAIKAFAAPHKGTSNLAARSGPSLLANWQICWALKSWLGVNRSNPMPKKKAAVTALELSSPLIHFNSSPTASNCKY